MVRYMELDRCFRDTRKIYHIDDLVEAGMVCFEQCPRLKGMEWFSPLFDAIVSRRVVHVTYHRFGHPSRLRIVHPSQQLLSRDADSMTFELTVTLNHEFEAKLLPFLPNIKIISP